MGAQRVQLVNGWTMARSSSEWDPVVISLVPKCIVGLTYLTTGTNPLWHLWNKSYHSTEGQVEASETASPPHRESKQYCISGGMPEISATLMNLNDTEVLSPIRPPFNSSCGPTKNRWALKDDGRLL